MAMSKYPSMNWNAPDVADTFKLYKQRLLLVCEDNDVTENERIARKIKIGMGDEGLRRLNASGLSDVEQKNPAKLWSLFETQLKVAVNFRIHRLSLMQYRQKEDESLDEFVTRARTQAQMCEFEDKEMQERIIELIIAGTKLEVFRRELLGKEKGLTLQEVLNEGRKHEAAALGTMQLQGLSEQKIDYVKTKKRCGNCGLIHKYRQCPAFKDTCKACGNKCHWLKLCRQSHKSDERDTGRKKQRNHRGHRVHAVEERYDTSGSTDSDEFTETFHNLKVSSKCLHAVSTRGEAFTTIEVQCPQKRSNQFLRLKIDRGAQGNALPVRTFRQMYGDIEPKKILTPIGQTTLTAYSGEEIKCLGSITLGCKSGSLSWVNAVFYIVDVPGPVILGLPTCEALKLVTINCQLESVVTTPVKVISVQDLMNMYPGQFDTVGKFAEPAKIRLKEDAEPHVDRPRKCNINLKPEIEAELKQMEDTGIIRKVREHTDWCSSIVYSTKRDGSLRICLDPKRLNESIKRCPHKMPTLEEINPAFVGAKHFNKLDAKAGYWSVQLEEQSQLLTTFRTPIGRYCYQRLPFGLCVSQDIFQQRMDEILESLEGCVGIADDICIFGATQEEHDQRLIALMEVAKSAGLVCSTPQSAQSTKAQYRSSATSTVLPGLGQIQLK